MRRVKNLSHPKKSVFSFVVDGECELWYLQLLKQHESLTIHLEPKIPVKKKLNDQLEMVKTLSVESEKVFWIVDFDTILKETKEAKKGNKTSLQEFRDLYEQCKTNEKIVIIVNNPCLEYWFLQHFEQTSKYFVSYDQLEKSLKRHLPDYEKKEKYFKYSKLNIYQKLKPYLNTAISNAMILGEFTFENTQTGMAEMYKIFNILRKGL